MRSSVLAAAFAAGALAVPFHQHQQREVVTDYNVRGSVVDVCCADDQRGSFVDLYCANNQRSSCIDLCRADNRRGFFVDLYRANNQRGSYVDLCRADDQRGSFVDLCRADDQRGSYVDLCRADDQRGSYVDLCRADDQRGSYVDLCRADDQRGSFIDLCCADNQRGSFIDLCCADNQRGSFVDLCCAQLNCDLFDIVGRQLDLEWDDGLASTAQKIAESCVYAHNTDEDGGGYGQNIAAGVTADDITTVITDLFYNGEVGFFDGLYGQPQPDMTNFEKWGHFTQVVWKSTTHVGCYTHQCGTLQNVGTSVPPYFTVCNYRDPGNYANEYADNVLEPLNLPSVDASYQVA
ncbi:hypothetical protein B0A50_06843 [Salinomyces thailandicus]|uniref:SCP domain-containing protein n=1 Tax=Salinomyces thailandicus TaxID=706561 RepID=A0A4U0TPU1_9PEZI|nr:hypothetical protein B0A50_06843 [Salinomyces thailandica]